MACVGLGLLGWGQLRPRDDKLLPPRFCSCEDGAQVNSTPRVTQGWQPLHILCCRSPSSCLQLLGVQMPAGSSWAEG